MTRLRDIIEAQPGSLKDSTVLARRTIPIWSTGGPPNVGGTGDVNTDRRIADAYLRADMHARARDARAKGRNFGCAAARVSDLTKFFKFTYGLELPDDDAGREDFGILAQHVARLNGNAARNIRRHAALWCSWMGEAEIERQIDAVLRAPETWLADELGKMLGLANVVRTLLGITTIGACDATNADRQKLRRERDRAKRYKQRRADYEANSLTKTEPWKSAKPPMSRATWYRREAKGKCSTASDDVTVTRNSRRADGRHNKRVHN